MLRAIAILPQVSAYPHICARQCPYCGGGILHRYVEARKRVKDIYVKAVMTMIYSCAGCARISAGR